MRSGTMYALVFASALAACGPKAGPPQPPTLEEPREVESAPAPVIEIPRTRSGDIARAELVHALDTGVGAFLTTVDVEAYAPEGRFVGWQVHRYESDWVDLVPGDVVLRVNGMRIETPTQVQTLWKSLRNASEIVVSATRNGEAFELRFTVQGGIQPNRP